MIFCETLYPERAVIKQFSAIFTVDLNVTLWRTTESQTDFQIALLYTAGGNPNF